MNGRPSAPYGSTRAVFLIEPVNETIGIRRSSNAAGLPACKRSARLLRGCCEIFVDLAEELAQAISEQTVRTCSTASNAMVPIDYDERDEGHQGGNVIWFE